MKQGHFLPADILLPRPQTDLNRFAVVACDQYTAQPDYWKRVEEKTKGFLSAYHMIFPELYLAKLQKDPAAFEKKVDSINDAMEQALQQDCLYSLENSMIYTERVLSSGAVRKGLIGRIDLEEYDFLSEKKNYIRATEGTILERIPVRVQIRKKAPMEFPHVMLLADDRKHPLLAPLSEQKNSFEPLYDFDLMEHGGHLRGWKLSDKAISSFLETLSLLEQDERENSGEERPMLFAVGDGNHSLAAAKACYEELKLTVGEEQAKAHPARYALTELVSLYDSSLEFEGIHRIIRCDEKELWAHLEQELKPEEIEEMEEVLSFCFVSKGVKRAYRITAPTHRLAVGCVQNFLDKYQKTHFCELDYVHGETVVTELTQQGNAVGFLLPSLEKRELFPAVMADGALPRKTFSMGEAQDKRFYLEGRKIK
jgi:uncharacterized protein (DUF1015 family)